ncbi:unnamed protein product [Cylindrotheca closterium]|uniref:Uncharacterized protein n=1 Tax=Cylindrotheca closterium TaxID=2856 RepID=A0AAD2CQK4_9STRA|nr:unnamed protein product [Cylindrotheca closterium]
MNVRNPKWSVPEYCKEIWISGSMDPDDLKYRRLLDLFLNCERKWNCIHLECQYAVSPTALLTLLEATFNKTNMLHLNNCMLDVPSFSSLYDGMASRNELRRITLEHSGPFLEEQMAIFAEGLSLAKDLEFLSLRNINLQSSRITEALIAGLQDNDTLECLNLSFCRIQRDTLPRLLASLYNHSKLTRLEIFTSNRLSPIIHDHIRDWLSRHDYRRLAAIRLLAYRGQLHSRDIDSRGQPNFLARHSKVRKEIAPNESTEES